MFRKINLVNTGKVTSTKEFCDMLSIIPVKVRDSDGGLIPTDAFLDDSSTASFCIRNLLNRFTPQSIKPAQWSISTMHPDELKTDSHVVTVIKIYDPDENNVIRLPPLYAIKEIPVSREDTVKKDDLENCHIYGIFNCRT